MLENKVIIYDDSCPMCKLYTFWFVAWGFLKPENRIGFASAPEEVTSKIDLVRGRHEIPLFDRSTGETIYGLKALTHLIGSRWKWLRPFFESRLFMWMFYPLYQVITYNRRVIAGCKSCCGFDCAPDLNRFYRTVYLVLASLFVFLIGTLLIIQAPDAIAGSVTPAHSATGIMMAFAFVGLIILAVKRLTVGSLAAWNFGGNYATSLLIVAIMLIPLAMIPSMANELAWFVVFAATLMGLEENRRRAVTLD